jgi:hypothetical protein
MGEPELRSDEKVLVRTPGVYVKSIPFEGILTNKRIILIDRAKNLLPPKEIPLVTIKEVETGENAIRDQIITLSVMAKTGEIRQMILTFSRQAGGNRIKERDAWTRIIKENASSSFDQVIRNVIPSPEPALRRTEPAVTPRYEVVHSPIRQPVTPYDQDLQTGKATDSISPVRRTVTPSPVPAFPPTPVIRPADATPADSGVFCSKCGNRVPAESVFCNRCGTPITRVPQVSASVQAPAPLTVAKTPSARPIDEEIQSIEPLIERSTDKVPPDPLRAAPNESTLKQSRSWYDEEEPVSSSPPEAPAPVEKPAGNGFIPRLFSAKSTEAAIPAPSYEDAGDTPPPPKPPRGRSLIPGKKTLLTAAGALFVILLVGAGAIFILPMLTSGGLSLPFGSGDTTPTPSSSSPGILQQGTIVIKETPAPDIPATGIYVHVNYLGGFKGNYGVPDMITNVPGNSGDRVWEVENATNSTVQATFTKLDGSPHELLVEIYKDGKALSSGTTTVGHGSVTLSVDMVTGIAAAPVTSGSASQVPEEVVTTAAVETLDASVYETPAATASPAPPS